MPEEIGLNRISLRVPEDLFRKLDDKRHLERTTFQAVGMELLSAWLTLGEKPAAVHEEEDVYITAAKRILASGDRDIAGMLRGFIRAQAGVLGIEIPRQARHKRKSGSE